VSRRHVIELGAVAVYLGSMLALSYAFWGPYDGVEYDPAWAARDELYVPLLVFHAAIGFAIGRWWALALPVAWTVLSAGAGGYDMPLWVILAFQLPFYWLPAIALGVAVRKIAEHVLRGPGRLGSTGGQP
jgi:hypothetical protein